MALKRISDYTALTPMVGTELLEVETAGGLSRKVTSQQIANLASGTSVPVVTALSITAGVVNVDLSLGDYFTLAHTANVTSLTFTNLPAAGKARTIALRVQQDATGGRTFAIPASFKAIAGSDVAVQSAATAYTILIATTFDQGARWEYSMKAGAP